MNILCSFYDYFNKRNILQCKQYLGLKLLLIIIILNAKVLVSVAQESNNSVNASKNIITGTVTDMSSGEVLAGVGIQLQGTNRGTITDINGNYSIEISSENDLLIFSFVGFVNEIIPVKGKTIIDVALVADIKSLEEVVVVGYGTQKKSTLAGAVSDMKGDVVKQSASENISNSLVGRMAGVISNNRSGEPGDDGSNIYIRGLSTFQDATHDNSPLVVIDGIAERKEGFEHLNPDDIESISILKDASAAIYGSRAANGVILITTKRGKKGKPVIDYNGVYGFSQPTRFPKLMNSYEYATWFNEINRRNNRPDLYNETDLELFQNGNDPIMHPSTDYYKETVKNWASHTNHTLSIKGGTDDVNYYISGMYLKEDAIFKNSAQNYKQYNLRSNIDVKVNQYIKVGLNVDGLFEKRVKPAADGYNSSSIQNMIWSNIIVSFPVKPAFYPNGLPGNGSSRGLNPALIASGKTGYDNVDKKYINSGATVDIEIPHVKGLTLSGMGNYYVYNAFEEVLTRPWDAYEYNQDDSTYENQRDNTAAYTSLAKVFKKRQDYTGLLKLNYQNSYGKHSISFFIASEIYKRQEDSVFSYRKSIPSDQLPMLYSGDQDGSLIVDSKFNFSRINYFGRLNYNYADKYLVEFVLRRDGSSNFPQGKRFGNFPGVSVAWRISEEPFIKNNFPFITQFKLRASWGKLGNDKVPPYQYIARYQFAQNGDGKPEYYYFGSSSEIVNGLVIPLYPNTEITWETSQSTNFGFESNFWNGILTLNFDYFISKRSDILHTKSASVPYYIGLNFSSLPNSDTRLPDVNFGKVENRGFEVVANHRYRIGKLEYNLSGNITFAENKVVDIAEAANVIPAQKEEGKTINGWLVFETDGIYTSADSAAEYPKLAATKIGDIKYIDVNGDSKITSDDMIRMNYSNIPKIVYGFGLDLSYKNFGFNILFQGQAKAKQLFIPVTNTDSNFPEYLYDGRWTPENPDATKVRAFDRRTSSIAGYPYYNNSYWLKDVWFLRCKSINISYSLPVKLTKKVGLSGARIYVTGFNLFTVDEVKYYDPELNRSYGDYYPQQRIINFGINITI